MIGKKKKSEHETIVNRMTISRRALIDNETPFAVREAYIGLRTNLMFCMTANKERACRVFAVTSSHPQEGKSLTSANIAISFAMLGKRTLLIDTDMRKPAQRRIWMITPSTGLCDFLADIGPLELAKVEDLPLFIACTGTIPPNPSELLSSGRMRKFIDYCSECYDYVILDTPPINTVADAQIISTFVDGVIVVAKSGSTTSDDLNSALEAIDRAGGNLCGVVLNNLNMKAMKYSYQYKYKQDNEYYEKSESR